MLNKPCTCSTNDAPWRRNVPAARPHPERQSLGIRSVQFAQHRLVVLDFAGHAQPHRVVRAYGDGTFLGPAIDDLSVESQAEAAFGEDGRRRYPNRPATSIRVSARPRLRESRYSIPNIASTAVAPPAPPVAKSAALPTVLERFQEASVSVTPRQAGGQTTLTNLIPLSRIDDNALIKRLGTIRRLQGEVMHRLL